MPYNHIYIYIFFLLNESMNEFLNHFYVKFHIDIEAKSIQTFFPNESFYVYSN
jgi:hypothetical protein